MDTHLLFTTGVQFLLLLLSVSIHEAAHAWAADLCGDPTARSLGRTSLNPARHFDPIGTLLFPALLLGLNVPFFFGWGRPTPVVDKNLRRPGRDDLLIVSAGSFANLLLVAVATIGIMVAILILGPEARQAGFLTLVHQTKEAEALSGFPLLFTLVRLATINAFLAVFNLIPLPPFDGGQIAIHLLPPDWSAKLSALRPYGFIIGIALALVALPFALAPFYGVLGLVINLI
jgi:Zn-dependent protease